LFHGDPSSADRLYEPIPGQPGRYLETPRQTDGRTALRLRAAAAVLGDAVAAEDEAAAVAAELATRYEEIDLLYTISDVLSRTVRLEDAAQIIVRELADVVGARRASILVHDEVTDTLRLVAGRGLETFQIEPVSVNDRNSIAARVFRTDQMLSYDGSTADAHPRGGAPRGYKGVSFVALPITVGPPGARRRPIGVINLTDRIGEDTFTAGHKKLLGAIANQVGAAIENARLMESERRRVRLDTELDLAQGLQAALMQPYSALTGAGDIGARIASAERVGGDFYKVVELPRNAVGVMLGDVSSHGLSAALLMAHTIAAAGVVAQTAQSPQQALSRLLDVIGDELSRAEMHVALFYGVIDRRRGVLRYANAGHPQAFLVPSSGEPVRLKATAPPLGLGQDRRMRSSRRGWKTGDDLLVLCSDGITETAGEGGERYGEDRLIGIIQAARARGLTAQDIVEAVFADLASFSPGPAADDRTLLIVRG